MTLRNPVMTKASMKSVSLNKKSEKIIFSKKSIVHHNNQSI